jgi:hypothetical protein
MDALKLSDVPVSPRRRAAQHLESIRGTEMGYNCNDLYLGENVRIIYRPDITGPAYYEFEVKKETRDLNDKGSNLSAHIAKTNISGIDGYQQLFRTPDFPLADLKKDFQLRTDGSVQGFIMVSAAEHDFPIPHWSLEKLPISHELQIRAEEKQKKIHRIYKIDALSYLAEDEEETEVGEIGEMPVYIPGDLAKKDNAEDVFSDDYADTESGQPQTKDASRHEIKFDTVSTWSALKKDYAKIFHRPLQSLQEDIQKPWEIEKNIATFGEGIFAGETHCVPLLEKKFALRVSGEAAEFVTLRVVKRPGGYAAAELTCRKTPFRRESGFDLTILYDRDHSETCKFFILEKTMPSNKKTDPEEE